MEVLDRFRADLIAAQPELDALQDYLATEGFSLTNVRVLELLLWTELEAQGYYRPHL